MEQKGPFFLAVALVLAVEAQAVALEEAVARGIFLYKNTSLRCLD